MTDTRIPHDVKSVIAADERGDLKTARLHGVVESETKRGKLDLINVETGRLFSPITPTHYGLNGNSDLNPYAT